MIDLCAGERQPSSVSRLIDYRANGIYPAKRGWVAALSDLMERYYKLESETRVSVRVKALAVMLHIYRSNRHMYEEELLERVVLPYLGGVPNEQSMAVKVETVKVRKTQYYNFVLQKPKMIYASIHWQRPCWRISPT